MNQPVNPYVAGAPLREERGFFGRQDTLDWVTQTLHDPDTNALVLLGQRTIGKTSLLLQLERTLPTGDFLSVYFDLQGQAARPLGQVLAGLAVALAGRAGLSPPGLGLFDDAGDFFRRAFLPRFYAVALGGGRRPVFLLDEFDALDGATEAELPETAAVKALFPFLREVGAGDTRPVFVCAVGRRAEDITLDFVATFDTPLARELGVLDWESAKALVRQAEANGMLQFSALAVSHILSFTNGHPYLTQLLCQRIWERAYAERPAEPPLIDTLAVEDAVPDALEAGGRTLAWLWDGLSLAEKVYTAALAGIVEKGETVSGDRVVRTIAPHVARSHMPAVGLAPDDLVRRWMLAEAREREYCFAVELFRLWVCQNKPLRAVVEDELDWIEPPTEQLLDVGQSPTVSPGGQAAQKLPAAALTRQDDALLDTVAEESDSLETTPVRAVRAIFPQVSQWMARVRRAFDEANYAEALRLTLPVMMIPVLSVLIFYGIGTSLARGMSGIAWIPSVFSASTFYRFGLVSAILGLFPGLRFAYEFIERPVFSLELVYLLLYRYVRPFLAVVLIYAVLTLLVWVSQASVSEEEWEGFRIFFGWLRRLWER